MNLLQQLRRLRRNVVRRLQISYAICATWVPPSYPEFMCIGAPRAATTWLYKKLRHDAQVFLPKAKELHFFDEPTKRNRGEQSELRFYRTFHFDMKNPAHFRWYSLQFQRSKGRKKGEITPSYSMLSEERVRLIRDTIPDLQVIYIIRNPIDRAWSTLRQAVLYQLGENRSITSNKAWLLRTVMHPVLLEGGNYRRAIKVWGQMIPPKNMLYLFYDDIVTDPHMVLAKVYSFLHLQWPGVTPQFKVETRVNAAPALKMPREVHSRLASYYEDQITYLETTFDRDLGHWTKTAG